MEAPLRQIVTNAGEEASVVASAVKNGEGNFGYNAGTEQYGDMIEMGILDPTKVTRSALQFAASVAGLMIWLIPVCSVLCLAISLCICSSVIPAARALSINSCGICACMAIDISRSRNPMIHCGRYRCLVL